MITTYHNIVGQAFANSGQMIATFQHNISTLLGATCRTHLATLLWRVATCWVLKIELVRMPRCNVVAWTWPNDYNNMQQPQMLHKKFDQFQIWANNTQHVTTCRNTSQQGGQTYVTCCSQQCCDVLRWNVAIVWPGLGDNPMTRFCSFCNLSANSLLRPSHTRQ